MEEILKIQQKIVPEMTQLLEKRYIILRSIYYNQPIGRRMLSRNLDLSERVVRTEISFLKEQGFIEITVPGMTITPEGENIIESLKCFIHDIKGLSQLEKSLKDNLGLKKVIIVPGNVDEDNIVMNELGKAAANYIKGLINNKDIVALTGGSTIKSVIDNMPKCNGFNDVSIVPARGGMGRNLETQSNTLVSIFANKLNCNYKLLHVPDSLSGESVKAMMKEKEIKETMDIIKRANILIYGIGRADKMAKRRGLSCEKIKELDKRGAVGEAFGHYFNRYGEIVYYTPTMGIKNEQVKGVRDLVAVSGGSKKAEAIISTEINNSNGVLITDESAARKMLSMIK